MKIQYKHQKFQADAAKAVVDVFAGQPYLTPSYTQVLISMGISLYSLSYGGYLHTVPDNLPIWAAS